MRRTLHALPLLAGIGLAACGGGGGNGGEPDAATDPRPDAAVDPDAPPGGPAAPTGLRAAAANGHAWLRWDEVDGASYEVLRADAEAGPFSVVGSPAIAWFDEGGLTDGATYYYAVRVVGGMRTEPAPVMPLAEPEICATDYRHNLVFTATPTVPVLRLYGSLPYLENPWAIAIDPVHDEIIVGNDGYGASSGYGSLVAFPRSGSGNRTPLRVITGPSTHLSEMSSLAIDPVHDEVFVTQRFDSSVRVYARGADGDAAPLRTIAGPATGLVSSYAVAVDPTSDLVYVGSTGVIRVFARDADGNTPPLRVIETPDAGAFHSLALIPAHGELLGYTESGIYTYPIDASGPTTATRMLAVPGNGAWGGIGYDAARDQIMFVRVRFVSPGYEIDVAVHHRTDAGTTAPLRTIATPAIAIAYDAAHDEVAVTTSVETLDPSTASVRVFDGSNGAPLRAIASDTPGLAAPYDVVSDAGEVWLANGGRETLAVFARDAFGPATAEKILGGAAADLDRGAYLALDAVHDEVFAAKRFDDLIAVFPQGASGDYAPSRTITGIDEVVSFAVDAIHDELVVWTPGLVRVLARTASGPVAAIRSFTVPSGLRGTLLVDGEHAEIYLADDHSAFVYDRLATGTLPAPVRTLSAEDIYGIRDVELDGDELVAVTQRAIHWFPRTATGATPPTRSVTIPPALVPDAIAICTP
jgi:hypothetical protein